MDKTVSLLLPSPTTGSLAMSHSLLDTPTNQATLQGSKATCLHEGVTGYQEDLLSLFFVRGSNPTPDRARGKQAIPHAALQANVPLGNSA